MSSLRDMREVRDRLVLAALNHVPFDGWSPRALREAAKDAGFDETMGERAFPSGVVASVEHFAELADRRLGEEARSARLDSFRLSQRVAWLVRQRISAWAPHREAVRRAVSLLSLPTNALAAMRASWRTVDTIWYLAGDQAVDYTYYTKRATLAAVYTATVLFWLEDSSEDSADTWHFLDRRLADLTRLPKLTAEARRRLDWLPNPIALIAGKGGGHRHFGVRRP
jgi:ubiquinone biosynthesis protein COQ9